MSLQACDCRSEMENKTHEVLHCTIHNAEWLALSEIETYLLVFATAHILYSFFCFSLVSIFFEFLWIIFKPLHLCSSNYNFSLSKFYISHLIFSSRPWIPWNHKKSKDAQTEGLQDICLMILGLLFCIYWQWVYGNMST